jgi:hypothetical protein
MTHLRRKPRQFEHVERVIYHAELDICPHCAGLLACCNHYAFTKTVQLLDRVVSIASRPKQCPNPACCCFGQRFFSAAAQSVALPNCTYGLDVVAQIGYWRDKQHLNGRQIFELLATRMQICRREVDLLSARYHVLRAAAEQLDIEQLAQSQAASGGLIISLDGLEPEGAQEQLWVVREVQTGLILLSAWLPRTSKESFCALLAPVVELLKGQDWRLLATVSDRERSLEAALVEIWPDVPHQWCQSHYLRNLMKPVAAADQALRVGLRGELREGTQAEMRRLANESSGGAFSPCVGEWAGTAPPSAAPGG